MCEEINATGRSATKWEDATTAHTPAPAPEYTYAGFGCTGIRLNLKLAKRDLLLAEDFIKEKNPLAATVALQDIQGTGVIFEYSSMQEPLVRAMNNLRLAESEVKAKHPEQAKVALAGAVDALKNYEKITGDRRSKEVSKLQKELDEVGKDIANEKEEGLSRKVSTWWDTRCFMGRDRGALERNGVEKWR